MLSYSALNDFMHLSSILQIASLKNALAKKDAEAEKRMRIGVSPITRDSRNNLERQRMRVGVSPMNPRMQTMGDPITCQS